MSERTGRSIDTEFDDVTAYQMDDGSYEVERNGVLLGTVRRYLSTTEVKPGKVRASVRRKPVQRWVAWPRFVEGRGYANRSTSDLRTLKAAIAVLAR